MPDHPPRCHCRYCNPEVQESAHPFMHSAIATLLCGLPNDMQQNIEASGACGTACAKAKELNVKLFSPKYWRISWNSLSLAIPGNFQVISSLPKKAPGNSPAGSKPSKASERYTPGNSLTPDSATPSAGSGRQNTASVPSGSSNNAPPQIQCQTPNNPPQSVPVTSAWILFGIQGNRWSLELEQITVSSLINDPTFFQELKARYKKHRGWLRMLLSPFRFQFCRFVKVCLLKFLLIAPPYTHSNQF
ncbi:uncharacterized protein BDR25DRAFT_113066 [Lindgomyces ingoldianus]|uniref:Uncharacterized protein n=1 Tax=Lindgomyces ingoldianus TaxID=673940 RepID=A0ACB6R6W9_9PLEO|nr:uncharacterized protein BDR25DRAFT_113066 [Lindgomyces ingoldianus]KAF2474931.1 hypothetical protein BDR25DRAFT_113066 [Lindgomyces ingoldianus]